MQETSFKQKTVLVTGASSGFGEETAKQFAQAGAKLILLARRGDRLQQLQAELIQTYHTECEIIVADIKDYQLIQDELTRIEKTFGMPEILINNAGMVKGLDKLWEVKPEEWNEMIDVNVKGILNMTRLILPSMINANKGHIINIGSISGHDTYPGGGVYCATKYAVRAITDTLRMELLATPIRVSLLSPGIAKTEFSVVRFQGDVKKADQVYEGLEALNSKDIADAILFIASRPEHVNIADIILLPKCQASPTMIRRQHSS